MRPTRSARAPAELRRSFVAGLACGGHAVRRGVRGDTEGLPVDLSLDLAVHDEGRRRVAAHCRETAVLAGLEDVDLAAEHHAPDRLATVSGRGRVDALLRLCRRHAVAT